MNPTDGLQEVPMDKSYKYNLRQPLVHRNCHQLPKPHMEIYALTIRMLAKLKERWAREKEEEERIKSLPTHTTIATIQVVEDLKTFSTHRTPSPNGPINGDANTSTIGQ